MKKDWIKKNCEFCGKEFFTPQYYANRKTCSKECRYKLLSISKKGTSNNGSFKKNQIPWNKGLTKEIDERLQVISEKSKQQMEREYSDGTRDRYEITKNANKKCRELVKEGKMVFQLINPETRSKISKENCKRLKSEGRLGFQNYDIQLKARKTCAGNSRGGSYIENKMLEILTDLNIKYIEQFKINHPKLNNFYFVDFLIPNNRIIIECDGEYFHQDINKDRYRQSIIEYYGYNFLRFSGKEIINDEFMVRKKIIDELGINI